MGIAKSSAECVKGEKKPWEWGWYRPFYKLNDVILNINIHKDSENFIDKFEFLVKKWVVVQIFRIVLQIFFGLWAFNYEEYRLSRFQLHETEAEVVSIKFTKAFMSYFSSDANLMVTILEILIICYLKGFRWRHWIYKKVYSCPETKYLLKVSNITTRRLYELCSNVILLTLNKYLSTGKAMLICSINY